MNFPRGVDSWVNVSIPSDHQAMVTLLDVDLDDPSDAACLYSWVELWEKGFATAFSRPPGMTLPPHEGQWFRVRFYRPHKT